MGRRPEIDESGPAVVLTIRVSESTRRRLEKLARRSGKTLSILGREAVEAYLYQVEEENRAREEV